MHGGEDFGAILKGKNVYQNSMTNNEEEDTNLYDSNSLFLNFGQHMKDWRKHPLKFNYKQPI